MLDVAFLVLLCCYAVRSYAEYPYGLGNHTECCNDECRYTHVVMLSTVNYGCLYL